MAVQTWVEPVVLEGDRVRLEPLRADHLEDLSLVAFDAPLWRWTIMGPQDEAGLRRWVDTALANAEAGIERPFATIDRASGRAIGSSRYLSIVPEHRRLEIGWTWVGTDYQRTGANREAKLLQLTHAFETLDAQRVEFKTHSRNERSRTALGGDRCDLRGGLPEPHDHARRVRPALGLLQHHVRGVAGHQGTAGRRARIIATTVTQTVIGCHVVPRSEAPP